MATLSYAERQYRQTLNTESSLVSPKYNEKSKKRLEQLCKYLAPVPGDSKSQKKAQSEGLKLIFEEILFSIEDKYDQKALRLLVDHLWTTNDKIQAEQAKTVTELRKEMEDLQKRVKQSQSSHDEVKQLREMVHD